MPRSQPPYCPHCQQLDTVRKVSAIVDSETRVVSTSAGASISSTRLAARLAPPDPPEPHRFRSLRWLITADMGRVVGLSSVFLALTALNHPGTWRYALLPSLLWGLALLGSLLVRHWLTQRDGARMAVWEAEVAAWCERYYCGRCDETFVPLPPAASTSYTGRTIHLGP